MIPAGRHPAPQRGGWRLIGVIAGLLVLGVAVRLVSPAIFLDIAALWPVGVAAPAVAWGVKKVWAGRVIAALPVAALLIFSWIVLAASFHFADLPGLPSSSADLRGPPAGEGGFETFSVELPSGRLLVAGGAGPSAYRVDMVRGGGGAGAPVAVESRGADGGEVRVIDARRPLPAGLGVTVDDNAWLRFAGWEVSLHPETTWRLTLTAPEISADLRNLSIGALAVNGGGPSPWGNQAVRRPSSSTGHSPWKSPRRPR